jgi:hypothetical protein
MAATVFTVRVSYGVVLCAAETKNGSVLSVEKDAKNKIVLKFIKYLFNKNFLVALKYDFCYTILRLIMLNYLPSFIHMEGNNMEDRRKAKMRQSSVNVPEERRTSDRRLGCVCGGAMEMKTMKVPGTEITFPIQKCPECGRVKFIPTMTFLSTRLADVEPVEKSLTKTTGNFQLLIPKSFERALNLSEDSILELSIEGFDKMVIRVINEKEKALPNNIGSKES